MKAEMNKPERLPGWGFSMDSGDGAAYSAKEMFPGNYVKVTKLTATEEITIEMPPSLIKLMAMKIEQAKELLR